MLEKIEIQEQIEKRWDKSQLYPLCKEYLTSIGLVENLERDGLDTVIGFQAMLIILISQSVEPSALVGQLRRLAEDVQTIANVLEEMLKGNYFTYDEETETINSRVPLPENLEYDAQFYQFLPPMIVPPLEVKDNNSLGYLTYKRTPLMGRAYHHYDIALDVLNKMNSNSYSINFTVYNNCENKFKDENRRNKKTKVLFDQRLHRVVNLMYETGNQFHFCWCIDYRGRVYPYADTLTAQGNDFVKAILEFSEPVTSDLDVIED